MHTFSLSTQWLRKADLCELEDSLVYRTGSGTARGKQWDPVYPPLPGNKEERNWNDGWVDIKSIQSEYHPKQQGRKKALCPNPEAAAHSLGFVYFSSFPFKMG